MIGNGNVALDVARILTSDPEDLAAHRHRGAALGDAQPRLAPRGGRARPPRPGRGRVHVPELIGLAGLRRDQRGGGHRRSSPSRATTPRCGCSPSSPAGRRSTGRRTLVLRFRTHAGAGSSATRRSTGIEVTRDSRDRGHRVRPRAPGDRLPRRAGHRPAVRRRDRHRSQRPRPRPPRGVRRRLGQARPDRLHRHQQVLRTGDRRADARRRRRRGTAGAHSHPRGSGRDARVARRDSDRRDAGWRAIDHEERRRGMQRGRPRLKIVDPAELRRVARETAGAQPVTVLLAD